MFRINIVSLSFPIESCTHKIPLYYGWLFRVINPWVTCFALYPLWDLNPTLEDAMIYFSIEG